MRTVERNVISLHRTLTIREWVSLCTDALSVERFINLTKEVENKETYEEALRLWGIEDQIFMLMEETSELVNAICKLRRGRVELPDVVTELADVSIMVEQMILAFDVESAFVEEKARKIERLKERLKKYGVGKIE